MHITVQHGASGLLQHRAAENYLQDCDAPSADDYDPGNLARSAREIRAFDDKPLVSLDHRTSGN
ncbi:MAG: hypothetical protein NXI12_03970 [Alphaproteobacteria bacterium]|nr:hypothetical protein [Alphaproteobacteria bacterium]